MMLLNHELVPALDPNPLPAPFWLFKVLLLVTFTLHLIAMNLMLGGAVLAFFVKRSKNQNRDRLFTDIVKKIPVFLPATITLGVAPLLFVQVLYGQFFYTSSILIAWPWFLVLILLTTAYYGFYYASFQTTKKPGSGVAVLAMSLLMVTAIGFIYSNNLMLSQVPANWAAKYFASPNGLHLNLGEPTLIPRFLHFFISAVAVGGLLLVLIAWANWKRSHEYARYTFKIGAKVFMFATMAQFLDGFWWIAMLPREIIRQFMGQNVVMTSLLVVGFLLAGAVIFVMSSALRTENIRTAAVGAGGLTAVIIAVMVVMRDMLRDAYLQPYFSSSQFTVKTQWNVLPLFLVLFLAGVGLWLYMLKRYGLFGGSEQAKAVGSGD